MNEAVRQARLRLWLRAESAVGLRAVRRPKARAAPAGAPAAIAARPVAQRVKAAEENQPAIAIAEHGARAAAPRTAPPAALPTALAVLDGPLLSAAERKASLEAMHIREVAVCSRCVLCQSRRQVVFGEGSLQAQVFFIGEGPGETEDETGRPFVGRSGELLDKMIGAMGLKRGDVYIANVVKCRPPNNRTPAPDEVAACTPFLERQLEIIRPRVIVTLGLPAARHMLHTNSPLGQLRGLWHEWRGIKVMPTYHPAFVLRNYTEETRKAVWSDLQKVMVELGVAAKK